MVADTLSRIAQCSLNTIIITQPRILEDLERLGVELVTQESTHALLFSLEMQPSLLEEIKSHQEEDVKLQRVKQNLERGKFPGSVVDEDGTLRFHNRLCVPDHSELKEKILAEAHNTRYSIHQGRTKIY